MRDTRDTDRRPAGERRIAPPLNASEAGEGRGEEKTRRTRGAALLALVSLALIIVCGVGIHQVLSAPQMAISGDAAMLQDAAEGTPATLDDGEDVDNPGAPAPADDEQGDATDAPAVTPAADASKTTGGAPAPATAPSGGSAAGSSSSGTAGSAAGTSPASALEVHLTIDASRAPGYAVSRGRQALSLEEGATVYDALVACGVTIGGNATYVSSIDGLVEFACGSGSGWMYSVNGAYPNKSCGDYVLSPGDEVVWVYTTDLGNDL